MAADSSRAAEDKRSYSVVSFDLKRKERWQSNDDKVWNAVIDIHECYEDRVSWCR